jgi:Pyruvate/2-oxoacid:ferredoxin oxidoreductase delta subunit
MVFGLWRSSSESIPIEQQEKDSKEHEPLIESSPATELSKTVEISKPEPLIVVPDVQSEEKKQPETKKEEPSTKEVIENPFQIICPPHVTKSSSMKLPSKWLNPDSKETEYEEVFFPILRYKMQVGCTKCQKKEWVYIYDTKVLLSFMSCFGSQEANNTGIRFLTAKHGGYGMVCVITEHTCVECRGCGWEFCPAYGDFEGRYIGLAKPLHEMFDLQAMAEYTVQFPPNLRRFTSFEQGKKFLDSIQLKEIKIDPTKTSPKDKVRKEMVENDRGTFFNETGLHVNVDGQIVSDLSLTPGEIRERLDGFEFFPHFTDERLGVPRQWVKLKTTKKLVQQVKEPENPTKLKKS